MKQWLDAGKHEWHDCSVFSSKERTRVHQTGLESLRNDNNHQLQVIHHSASDQPVRWRLFSCTCALWFALFEGVRRRPSQDLSQSRHSAKLHPEVLRRWTRTISEHYVPRLREGCDTSAYALTVKLFTLPVFLMWTMRSCTPTSLLLQVMLSWNWTFK